MLIVVAGILILAVGLLLMATIERKTARSFVDLERANLAAQAGLGEVEAILRSDTANDDFVILQSALSAPIDSGKEPAPHLFIARGDAGASPPGFTYQPLFSHVEKPDQSTTLKVPDLIGLTGNSDQRIDFTALPYLDDVRVSWVNIRDENDRVVSRYAYWVEDMQSRVDPAKVGNEKGTGGQHARAEWPFPAPGLNPEPLSDTESALDQIALFAIDPSATQTDQKLAAKTLLKNHKILVTPESLLAAAEINPPLTRLRVEEPANRGKIGDLAEPLPRAIERGLATGIRPYLEKPLIPYSKDIDPSVVGKPKLNLNELLTKDRASAVDEMAAHIRLALPNFDHRKGGFPDDYIKTLAANALDYADEDNLPTLLDGVYRGIDSYPLTTELVLKVDYRGMTVTDGRQYLNFNFRVFAELHNPTSMDVTGSSRLSYEVVLKVSPIGSGTGSPSFDSPLLLDSSTASTHNLDKIGGGYWSKPLPINLKPSEYKCYLFADVTYRVDQGTVASNPISSNTPFSLLEDKGESGNSLMWNDLIVERQQGVVRQQGFVYGVDKNGKKTGGYLVGTTDILSKAHLPGLLYSKPSSGAFYGNTGDPRISHYLNRLKDSPLDESAYPENSSPNRRALRKNIYNSDTAKKPKVYARMLPSEWADGGHDTPVGTWSPGTSDDTEIIDSKFDFTYDQDWKHFAIQQISNRGYFLSATEFGHVFDPIMFAPEFETVDQTTLFWSTHIMPEGVSFWPDAKTPVTNARNLLYGGGNTLRIGRPEHGAFDIPHDMGRRAIGLLNLFHTGQPLSIDVSLRTGPLINIDGHVNLNTASPDALRMIAAGELMMDPKLSKVTNTNHSPAPLMAPPTQALKLDAPTIDIIADKIAEAIIKSRPYVGSSEMALAKDLNGMLVFGNPAQYPDAGDVQWTDSAAEEVFARIYQSSTVRSRNFRVWIVGQSINPTGSTASGPEILSEVRKVHTFHAAPGIRNEDGNIIKENFSIKIISTNEF